MLNRSLPLPPILLVIAGLVCAGAGRGGISKELSMVHNVNDLLISMSTLLLILLLEVLMRR